MRLRTTLARLFDHLFASSALGSRFDHVEETRCAKSFYLFHVFYGCTWVTGIRDQPPSLSNIIIIRDCKSDSRLTLECPREFSSWTLRNRSRKSHGNEGMSRCSRTSSSSAQSQRRMSSRHQFSRATFARAQSNRFLQHASRYRDSRIYKSFSLVNVARSHTHVAVIYKLHVAS